MSIINVTFQSPAPQKKDDRKEDVPLEKQIRKGELFLTFLIPAVLLLPVLAWISLDRSPFGGDQSQYAMHSVDLFHGMITSPQGWMGRLLAPGEFKAPGIAWIGQFFVPIGYLIRSVDRGLLYSIVATQFASLVLLFWLIREITNHNALIATLGCVTLASAPLFIVLSQDYLVEPLQNLSMVWFLLIMGLAPRWSRALTISQLLGATTLAMLAKVSSPLFCFVPGLVALGFALSPGQSPKPWGWRHRSTLLTLVIVIPLSIATVIWYYHNFEGVLLHARASSSGKGAAFWVWGKEDTYYNTLMYWLIIIERSFIISNEVLIPALGIFFIATLYFFLKPKTPVPYSGLFSLAITFQIAAIVGIFGFSSNRTIRYLLPALPYFSVLLCLLFGRINKPFLTGLLIGIFFLQFGFIHAHRLGILDRPRTLAAGAFLSRLDRSGKNAQVIESIVDQTCKKPHSQITNVLAIDPLMKGDWLAPAPANYVVAKNLSMGIDPPPCTYTYIGNSFFGASPLNAWNHILSANVKFVIIIDPQLYIPAAVTVNQTLNKDNLPIILNYLQNSGYYRLIGTLPEDPGIVIYKRTGKKYFFSR